MPGRRHARHRPRRSTGWAVNSAYSAAHARDWIESIPPAVPGPGSTAATRAPRYFIQALRLAQASGDRALGGHILADMATQARSLGDAAQALDLASAGLDGGSPLTQARCAAWQGRAHALRGDQRACAQACSIAERALDRAVPPDDRVWFKLFTADHLAHEMLHMASDLGTADDLQRRAPGVLASASAVGMARRRVLGMTALAHSYLPSPSNSRGDIDQACDLLCQVIPSLGSLNSTRGLESVNSVRRALAPTH